MIRMKSSGFSIIGILILIVVVLAIGGVAYKVLQRNHSRSQNASEQSGEARTSDNTKEVSCGSQPELQAPVDVSKATGLLYPGQYRGSEYKAHGGFRFDNSKPTDIMVKAPLSAKLERAGRYTQSGDVQILLEFTGDCSIAYRFDHILTVAPKLQSIIDALPAPTSDSRTQPVNPQFEVKLGDEIAIAVGSPMTNNVFVDFGVYDTSHKNKASEDPAWLAKHQNNPTDQYGICWLELLAPADAAKVKALPAASQESGTISDYCR